MKTTGLPQRLILTMIGLTLLAAPGLRSHCAYYGENMVLWASALMFLSYGVSARAMFRTQPALLALHCARGTGTSNRWSEPCF